MVIVWSKRAVAELKKAYDYICESSPQNAAKVRDEIIDKGNALTKNPDQYPPDKYKSDNDGNWRAFEVHHYRISYRITPTQIEIVRLRHTSRSPRNY